MDFMGYRRESGAVGTRNHVLVMSSVSCANGVVEAIGRELPEVKTITHTEGCGRATADSLMARRTLAGLGGNPNVAAVLVVGLGCESIKAAGLAAEIGNGATPVEKIDIQVCGGSVKATAEGIRIARRMLADCRAAVARSVPIVGADGRAGVRRLGCALRADSQPPCGRTGRLACGAGRHGNSC